MPWWIITPRKMERWKGRMRQLSELIQAARIVEWVHRNPFAIKMALLQSLIFVEWIVRAPFRFLAAYWGRLLFLVLTVVIGGPCYHANTFKPKAATVEFELAPNVPVEIDYPMFLPPELPMGCDSEEGRYGTRTCVIQENPWSWWTNPASIYNGERWGRITVRYLAWNALQTCEGFLPRILRVSVPIQQVLVEPTQPGCHREYKIWVRFTN